MQTTMTQKNTHIFQPEILLEEYRKLLADPQIDSLPLVITGNSMSPFLIHGRDTVYLSRIERPLRRGDVILYRRDDGAYILHRVYAITQKAETETYTMVGDAQSLLEPGIRREQMIAVMTAADRKGRRQEPGCFWWEFFEKVWIRMVPVRQTVRAVYERIRFAAQKKRQK